MLWHHLCILNPACVGILDFCNSCSALRDSQLSVSGVCLFSQAYQNRGALFSGCFCSALLSLSTAGNKHTHLQCPSTRSLRTLTHTITSRLRIQASHCCHGDHFHPVSTSEICLEESNCPPHTPPHPHPPFSVRHCSCPSTSSLFPASKTGEERKNPILLSQEAWLFPLLFFPRFIPPQSSTAAVPSLPTLPPTPHDLSEMLAHTGSVHRLGQSRGVNLHLLPILTTQDDLTGVNLYFLPFPRGNIGSELMYSVCQRSHKGMQSLGTFTLADMAHLCAEFDLYASAERTLIT